MKITDLKFKVGDEVFSMAEIGYLRIDPVELEIQIFWQTENTSNMRVVSCAPRDVEVIVDGE